MVITICARADTSTRRRYFRDGGAETRAALARSRMAEQKSEREEERIDGGWK